MKKPVSYILILILGLATGIFISQNETIWNTLKKPFSNTFTRFDDTSQTNWDPDFKVVDIKSTLDNSLQKAYFYKSNSTSPKPLVVSLHTWSGNYEQKDELAALSKTKDLNYIHPDFRGVNWTKDACCSDLALGDIDDAIDYAIKNSNVDLSRIYVIGVSGGGYATLATFMKSRHLIRRFSAWVPISDLPAWYAQSKIVGAKYAENIMDCTSSKDSLNMDIAIKKSPIYWNTPVEKLNTSELNIYAGVYDGIQGSVPITHSINFYNKVLKDKLVSDSSIYVSDSEKLNLLEYRKALGDFGIIAGRKVFLKKQSGNLSLTIFEGNHEMLTEYAFNELIKE
ncbi:Prolyl oligopeptidase family protein [Daejeonella rubra]|uniref:Prolyl oligopeptidase family protein n=1 Tax=Daejeonella rubra TaxID=990371 RepID=A0A1G9RG65_9SPHI|nr:prolyl oligopeptidase family serine peptidase [Daejeonella rubra]SDM22224.1 Prolyl oligopeptidase family protein [Daejeonella rubra]